MKTKAVFLLVFLWAYSAFASSAFRGVSGSTLTKEKDPPVTAKLLVFDTDYSESIKAGVYFKINPDWHLYWINPGDSGMPPGAVWDLPEGFIAGELIFPVPQKFTSSGQVTYGFTQELLLLCEIKTPEDFQAAEKPAVLSARVDWMACRESCTLGSSEISLKLSDISPSEWKEAKKIERKFRPAFPRPSSELEISVKDVKILKSPKRMTVEIPLAGEDVPEIDDFYPNLLDGFVMDQKKSGFSEGAIHLQLTPSREAEVLSEISGLLIINGSGYEISVSVSSEK